MGGGSKIGYDGTLRFNTRVDNSGFESGIRTLSSAAKSGAALVAKAFAAVGTGLGVAAGAAVKVGMDFEAGMSKVAAVSGAAGAELDALTTKAKEMGEKTKFSATESAEAFNYMAMAGWKTKDMLGGIDGIMNLAAASGENLGLVSDIVTDALTAFGLAASDSGHFADVLAKASSNSNTNVAMMGATFKYVAPIAGAMKYSIEDTALAVGLMANAGIKAEQAGTALRGMLTRLVKPPKMAAKALEELNFTAENADGSMKPLRTVLVELREKFATLTDSEKANTAARLAGQEAMSGFLAIMNASEADFNKLAMAVDTADGAAASMAETMNDNLKGKITILGSTLEGLGIKIYDKFEQPMKKAAEAAIDSISNLSKSMSSGKLSKSVENLASSIGNGLASFVDFTATSLPKMINGLALVIDNVQNIGAALGAATIAVGIFKGAMILRGVAETWATAATAARVFGAGMAAAGASLTATQAVVGGLTRQIGLATAAQQLLNATINMSAWGLFATAALAATAAFVIFSATREKEKTEVDILIDSIGELSSEIEKEAEVRDSLKQVREQAIEDSETEINITEQRIKTLEGLQDANGKIKDGEEARAQVLAEQINSVIPEAITLTEKEGETYLTTADSLETLINMKRANAFLEANQAEYDEALKNQVKNVENVKRANEELTAAKKALAEEQAKEKDFHSTMDAGYEQHNKRLKELTAAVETASQSYISAKDDVYNSSQKIFQQEELMIAIKEQNMEKIEAILQNSMTGLKQYGSDQKAELIQQYKDQQENYEAAQKAFAGRTDEATTYALKTMADSIDKAKEMALNGGVELAELNSIAGENSMNALAQGIFTGQVTVANAGVATLNALLSQIQKPQQMSDAAKGNMDAHSQGIEDGQKSVSNAGVVVAQSLLQSLDNQAKLEELGGALMQGLSNGIGRYAGVPVAAAANVALQVAQAARDAVEVRSPSRVFYKIGEFITQGLANGIAENGNTAVGAMEGLAGKILSTGDALSTGLITKDIETGQLIYDNLYSSVMNKIDLYYQDRDKRIALMNDGTEENIKAVQREVKETEKATDLKIKLYQQEYKAKIQLLDDETSEATKALQQELDAIDAAEAQKQREQEELDYKEKINSLHQRLIIANEEERADIFKEIKQTEADRQKVLDKQALQDKKDSIRQQMEQVREEAAEKKKVLQEELEAKEYQLQQQRTTEVEHMNVVISLMQAQVDKKKELEKIASDISKAEEQVRSDDLAREKEKQTKKELTELQIRENAQKEKDRQKTITNLANLKIRQEAEQKNFETGIFLLQQTVDNYQSAQQAMTKCQQEEAKKRQKYSNHELFPATSEDNGQDLFPTAKPQTDGTIQNSTEQIADAIVFQEQWSAVPKWFGDEITIPMSETAKQWGNQFESLFAQTVENIQATLVSLPGWTQENFFNPMQIGFKGWSNGLIATIEGVANSGVSAINALIGRLNTISIKPPRWLRERGYDSWHVELSQVNGINIPRLAKGGVIPPNLERLFIAGDNKTENEIIAPESLFRSIVRQEMEAIEKQQERRQRLQELAKTQEFQMLFAKMEAQAKSMMHAPIPALPIGATTTNHYGQNDNRMTLNFNQPIQSPSKLRRTLEKMSRELGSRG